MKTKLEKELLDAMSKNPDNWKAGVIYFNKKDPRIIVPKLNQYLGWTINFASPYAYALIIAIIGISFSAKYFFKI
jgi:uncharacterized membrane protein